MDMNSVLDHENNLMSDLQESYPDQDMRGSFQYIPLVVGDYMSNCARSSSGTSELSIMQQNQDHGERAAKGLDVLVIEANGKD